jgi:6-phosphogluconolactonase
MKYSSLYIGTYAEAEATGIYLYQMDSTTGALEYRDRFKAGANPSFLTLSPNRQFLYAVNELDTFQGQPGGAVSAFAVDPSSGKLTFLNQQPSHGGAPCHLITDHEGRFLFVANYLSGTLSVYPIDPAGHLGAASHVVQHLGKGVNAERQEGPHAHFVTLTPDNRFVLSCDLGIDQVLVYRFDSVNGKLLMQSQAELPPGAGPRHLDFHPTGKFAYVINELDSTLTVFDYAAETGRLTKLQTLSTLPEGYTGFNSCAEVAVHPTGRYVYGSNRGHDSLVIYAVDEATGKLTVVGHEPTRGKNPRHFAIDPTGSFLLVANQDGDNVITFQIDTRTGQLSYRQQIAVPKPVCLTFSSIQA